MPESEIQRPDINKKARFINLLDDEIQIDKEDKNSIYSMLQKQMAKDDPELAAYVAGKMSQSLTLEEANLIGDTALVVYQMMKHKTDNPKSDQTPKTK